MTATAVVFGATGLVGDTLINELIRGNTFDKIIAVTRRELPYVHEKLEQLVMKDFSQLQQLGAQLKAGTFFCCIGTTIKIAGSQEAFRKVDFEIPLHIAQLAEELTVPGLVVISSIGANARSSNFYLRTKGEMENSIRKAYSGNLKIFRPSLLMGNRDEYRAGEKAAVAFMKALGWLFIGPARKYRGIQARDVARAMILSTGTPPDKVLFESDEIQEMAAQ